MKSYLLILLFTILNFSCGDYNHKDGDSVEKTLKGVCAENLQLVDRMEVFEFVEEDPVYNGGMDNLYRLIGKEIKMPVDQKDWQRITVVFVVDTLGKVRNECILKKDKAADFTQVEKEVLEAVKKHQNWIHGKHNGKKVPVGKTFSTTVGHKA